MTLVLALPLRSQAAVLPTLDYTCEPPAPASAANCALWHTSPVTLHWIFDSSQLTPVSGTDCSNGTDRVIATDTAGMDLTCTVTSLMTGPLTQTATIRIDQTPPAVTGAVPDRPPDHNGWYNHPVTFTFAGSDATSGIAGCDGTVYSGPDTAAGTVSGGCRDVAGNAAGGSAPLMYDATPPTITPIPQESKDGQVNLQWSSSPDAVEYTVTRTPGTEGPAPSTVYTGSSPSYTDNNVANSHSYTYTINASDAAANSSSAAVVAVTGGSQTIINQAAPQTAPKGKTRRRLPCLRWRRVRSADYYNVQLYRGRRKILSAWPSRTRLQLRASWRFRGKRFRLTPDHYHWYVWPGYGNRRAHHYGHLIAHRRLTVRKST